MSESKKLPPQSFYTRGQVGKYDINTFFLLLQQLSCLTEADNTEQQRTKAISKHSVIPQL